MTLKHKRWTYSFRTVPDAHCINCPYAKPCQNAVFCPMGYCFWRDRRAEDDVRRMWRDTVAKIGGNDGLDRH